MFNTTIKEESYAQKHERYIDLHFEMLNRSNGAIMNNDILTHATQSLNNGYTVEETMMRSILFGLALQMENTNANAFKTMYIIKSAEKILGFLSNWRHEGKIRSQVWNKRAHDFHSICSLKSGRRETLTAILHDLRNPIIVS